MRITVKLAEPGTAIKRDLKPEPKIYPDTIAGLQCGDRYTLDLGTVTITGGAVDMLTISRMIREGILGKDPS